MDVKEKLVELLMQVEDNMCDDCGREPVGCAVVAVADHLMANGLTMAMAIARKFAKDNNVPSKWIPVTERLPTIEDATERGAVLAWEVSVKHWDIWAWDCVRDYHDRFIAWMPLPQPPKGE